MTIRPSVNGLRSLNLPLDKVITLMVYTMGNIFKKIKDYKPYIIQVLFIIFLVQTYMTFGKYGFLGLAIAVILIVIVQIIRHRKVLLYQLRKLETVMWGKSLDKEHWQKGEIKNVILKPKWKRGETKNE